MASQVGKWAFLIGVVLAVITGIGAGLAQEWGANPWLMLLLVVLGLVVGFVNITAKEVKGFLIASVALLVAGTANLSTVNTLVPSLGSILEGIVNMVIYVVAPAALIVCLRAIYGFAAEK
ncbi:hypothetical protein KY331_04450 [Candidatus Woesearchaeota archaeon]|nr:hypothetical protein [Candidatus Woesearchaeota archaeon]